MVQVKDKVIRNSTFKTASSDSSNKAMQLWNSTRRDSGSISSIEEIFDPTAIKQIVESLVMTKFGSHYSELFLRSNSRRSRRNSRWSQMSKGSSDMSISTCGISGLISLQYRGEAITPQEYAPTEEVETNSCEEKDEDDVQSYTRSSQCDPSQAENLNLRLTMLQETKEQLVKAINYHEVCSRSSKAMFRERIEAEKLLLVTDIEASLLSSQDDISLDFCSGTVELSNIHILPEKTADHYFMCVVTCGSNLFASKVYKAKSNGIVYFQDKFTVSPLQANFKIHVKVYSLAPKSIGKPKKSTIICGKHEEVAFRESLFTPWGEFDLRLRHLTKSRILQVQLVAGSFNASVLSYPNINVSLTGFVNVSPKTHLSWNRQWCTLNGTFLKFYNEPSAEWYNSMPTITIDLMNSAKLRVLSREECARKNTVSLITSEISVLLSWDSSYKFQCWLKYLELVISEIKVWEN